jgi:hypothetical protein
MRTFLLLLALLPPALAPTAAGVSFRHHSITRSFPGVSSGSGYGTGGFADFDRDGRQEFAFCHTGNQYYRYEHQSADSWTPTAMGPASGTLGGNTADVDRDGWPDLVSGRYWYRNNRAGGFTRLEYDPASVSVHDVGFADINGDGVQDVVVCSDGMGIYWYETTGSTWPKHLVTLDALASGERIHGGLFPRGLADLNRDGRVDVVAARYWYENLGAGLSWRRHDLPFSRKKGPWGWSARSWAVDMDRNGTTDLVMTDCDQADSRAAVLFSNGANPPAWTVLPLPKTAAGTRGSFHSLAVADFDRDGDLDVFTVEQDDTSIAPVGAGPRWYVWENLDGSGRSWAERVVLDNGFGGHDAFAGDVDGDGDVDVCSKVWAPRGSFHADWLENLSGAPAPPPPPPPSGGIPTSGLAAWFKADAGYGNGQWLDQSGNGRHATQPDPSRQPGPGLQFDGVNDFLQFNLPIGGWQGMTAVLVSSSSADPSGGSNGGQNSPLFWEETAPWGWTFLSPFQTSVKLRFGTTQSGNLPAWTRPSSVGTALTTTISRHDGTTDELFVNGSRVWSAGGKLAPLQGAVSTPYLGRGAGNTYFAGRIAEVLIYNRALTDAERQSVEQALAAKYAQAPPPPPPSGGSNLAPNPGFESDPNVDYFTHGSGTFSWASDAAHGGSRSLKIASGQPVTAYARWLSRTTRIPAQAGGVYTASVWLKTANAGGRGVLAMNFWNASSAVLASLEGGSITGTRDWTKVSVTGTAPAGTAYVRVEFRLWGPGTLWADDVSLSR